MKKLFLLLVAAAILVACTNTNKQAINSRDLKGRYDVDLSALMSSLDDEEDGLATALAAMFLSSMEMTLQFEDTKLILDASGMAINLVNAFLKEDLDMPLVVDYKIVNDSVLYTKADGKDFGEVGVLRKVGDSYDYLQLVINEDDGPHTIIKLKKHFDK